MAHLSPRPLIPASIDAPGNETAARIALASGDSASFRAARRLGYTRRSRVTHGQGPFYGREVRVDDNRLRYDLMARLPHLRVQAGRARPAHYRTRLRHRFHRRVVVRHQSAGSMSGRAGNAD